MKKIGNLIFTIVLMAIILIVYFNLDYLKEMINKYLLTSKEVVIKDSNSYRRNYYFDNFTYIEDFVPYSKDNIINIYFNILNNGWDTFTFYCPKEYVECSTDINEIANNSELLSNINNYVHPFNSFEKIDSEISSLGEITVKVTHKYNDSEISLLNKKIEELSESLELYTLSDEEKIKKIHNYLINNITYDNETTDNKEGKSPSTSAYGALMNGRAVCSGYADALSLFLDYFKIPNTKISSENHLWNLVYLNSKWKHIDVTWDDVEIKKYNYNYFLINTEELLKLDSEEHNFDKSFFTEAK